MFADTLLSAKFDDDMRIFFVNNPDQKFLLFQYLLGSVHSYTSPRFIWTSHWLDWRTLFVILHADTFLSAKFDNDISSFFLDNPDQKFLLFKNVIGWIHSHSSPHFNWTSSWLYWRTLFVKMYADTFLSAKFDDDMRIFFVNNPDQKFLLFQYLLGSVHSYISPRFIWTSHWLDWRTLFVILHADTFLSAKFDNDISSFFRR